MPYRSTDHAADDLGHACGCAAARGHDAAAIAAAHGQGHAHAHADGFTLPGAAKHFPPDLALEPIHLALDLRVDIAGETAGGTATTTVRSHHDGASELTLNAVDLMDVAVADADGHALTWTYDGSEIRVRWAEGIARGETRRVSVGYRVASPIAGMFFSHPTDAVPDAPMFVVTDHETERARYWLPCIDQPNARTRLDIRITADARFTILANGGLVDETMNVDANGVSDGTKSAHWRLDFPCPSYLLCFAVGDFVRCDDGEVDGVPIAYFTTAPATPDDLRRSFGRTGAMLRWLNGRLGTPYPFPKYYQIALPGIGGAMENISLVTWDGRYVLDETLALEMTRGIDEINVHEMAHAWFGDAIVCRDYAHAWLKESWATYMEQVWFDDVAGADEGQYQFWRDARAYIHEADHRYKRPLVTREFNSSWQMYDRHLYPGGACRLHTLRRELGDALFWEGVQAYVRNHFGGVVETDDLRRALENVSGRSLGRFFDQWIYSPGYPDIKVTFSHDADKAEGTFVIEQTQADKAAGGRAGDGKLNANGGASSSASAAIPVFALTTAVGWTIDGVHHRASVKITDARHTIVVPMAKAPSIVRFDPDCAILHKLRFTPSDAMLRAQLTGAPDVIGRILAGRELCATAKRANIEAVAAAYAAEPFWGVRIEWAAALGHAGTAAAVDALAGIVSAEADPRVIASVFGAADAYRDVGIAGAIERRLAAGLPHQAAAAAYRALGAQRAAAPIDVLLTGAATVRRAGFAQGGALAGLAMTRDDAAFGPLLAGTYPGMTPEDARFYAASALAEWAATRPRDSRERVQTIERLEDLLRDRNDRVQSAAARGLAMLGSGAAAIERYKKTQAVQDHFVIDRLLGQARGGGDEKVTALAKQLDGLRDDFRTVRNSVETLEAKVSPTHEAEAGGADEDRAEGKTKSKGKGEGKAGRKAKSKGMKAAKAGDAAEADNAAEVASAVPGGEDGVADKPRKAAKAAAKKAKRKASPPPSPVAPPPGTEEPQLRPDEPADAPPPQPSDASAPDDIVTAVGFDRDTNVDAADDLGHS
ncbi:MAG: M1 family metallopeptidase [Ardenticatenales bacterium]